MSGENRSSTTPPPPLVIYTVYPDFQGNKNYGFQDKSQIPPPKYEDVISGEYLNSNYYSNYDYPPPVPTAVAHQVPSSHDNCTCSRTNTLQSVDSTEEDYKPHKCNFSCCILIFFVLLCLFALRMHNMYS